MRCFIQVSELFFDRVAVVKVEGSADPVAPRHPREVSAVHHEGNVGCRVACRKGDDVGQMRVPWSSCHGGISIFNSPAGSRSG